MKIPRFFRRCFAFTLLASVKTVTHVFFKLDFKWEPDYSEFKFDETRMIIFLNHTSLYEPVYLSALPYSFLWRVASHISLPIADVTMNRPIVGFFFRLMLPKVSTITRKMDGSWERYLNSITPKDLVIVAAEGRMKRPNGLDKNGKPMSVRGGVADIIEQLHEGYLILCFSGGLHHIQAPGQWFPNLFKTIRMKAVQIPVSEYKKQFSLNARERKLQVVADLEKRLKYDCPEA